MTQLRISSDLALPIDFVTKTAAILAQRRKGKTYTAAVIAEELVAARIPWVALDPTGAWWGLLAAANGVDAGLPIVVIGGQHEHLPLDADGGRFLADMVLDHPGYYVFDLSLLGTKAAERHFAYTFADRLYRQKMKAGMDFPLHLFVDEADMFVPQERDTGDNLMLGAFQSIVRRGGLHGLGTTLISQRPALVNKNVLTQLDMLILLRLVAGNDQDYLDKNYVKRAGTAEQRAELMASLASLALGEAWVWEPGAEPPLFQRVQIRERHTFNSSATPRAGEKRVEPERLADVDLAALKEAMAETIERAKADDPKELRKRIAELERQVRDRPVETVTVTERVEIVPGELIAVVNQARRALLDSADALTATSADLAAAEERAHDRNAVAQTRQDAASSRVAQPVSRRVGASRAAAAEPNAEPVTSGPRPRPAVPSGGVQLKKGALRMLHVLAQFHPQRLTRDQLSTLAEVTRGGTFSSYLSSLNMAGYIDTTDRDVALTDDGIAAAGDAVAQAPLTTDQLVAAYSRKLKSGARRMLDLLVDAYPDGYSRNDLSDAAEVTRGGTFSSYLSSLVTNGLADATRDEVKASPTLFLGRG